MYSTKVTWLGGINMYVQMEVAIIVLINGDILCVDIQ